MDLFRGFDRGIALFLNQFVGRAPSLDRAFDLTMGKALVSGIFLVTCVCYLWGRYRQRGGPDERPQIAQEFIGVCFAGPISRSLQFIIDLHPRPFNDPSFRYGRVHADADFSHHWGSFPSDHAAVYFALAFLVMSHSRKLGIAAMISASLSVSMRVYLGYHWTSDVIAGAMVGVLCVWSARKLVPASAVAKFLRWEESSPAYFNVFAFLLCYLVGTLYDDIRSAWRGAAKLMHGG